MRLAADLFIVLRLALARRLVDLRDGRRRSSKTSAQRGTRVASRVYERHSARLCRARRGYPLRMSGWPFSARATLVSRRGDLIEHVVISVAHDLYGDPTARRGVVEAIDRQKLAAAFVEQNDERFERNGFGETFRQGERGDLLPIDETDCILVRRARIRQLEGEFVSHDALLPRCPPDRPAINVFGVRTGRFDAKLFIAGRRKGSMWKSGGPHKERITFHGASPRRSCPASRCWDGGTFFGEVFFIFVTGLGDCESEIAGRALGADDWRKSRDETAEIMCVIKRNMEFHIDNAQSKLGFRSRVLGDR